MEALPHVFNQGANAKVQRPGGSTRGLDFHEQPSNQGRTCPVRCNAFVRHLPQQAETTPAQRQRQETTQHPLAYTVPAQGLIVAPLHLPTGHDTPSIDGSASQPHGELVSARREQIEAKWLEQQVDSDDAGSGPRTADTPEPCSQGYQGSNAEHNAEGEHITIERARFPAA